MPSVLDELIDQRIAIRHHKSSQSLVDHVQLVSAAVFIMINPLILAIIQWPTIISNYWLAWWRINVDHVCSWTIICHDPSSQSAFFSSLHQPVTWTRFSPPVVNVQYGKHSQLKRHDTTHITIQKRSLSTRFHASKTLTTITCVTNRRATNLETTHGSCFWRPSMMAANCRVQTKRQQMRRWQYQAQ